MTVRVFLVPGFFGFTNLGDFAYFSHFREVLAERLAEAGVEAVVHPLDTLPTSSMLMRARRLFEHVKAHYQPGDEIHLVGHSTGGLDARLLASEGFGIQGKEEILPAIGPSRRSPRRTAARRPRRSSRACSVNVSCDCSPSSPSRRSGSAACPCRC